MTPYEEGIAARASGEPEPPRGSLCPYPPGSPEYAAFARGFCLKPFSCKTQAYIDNWIRLRRQKAVAA